MDEKWKIALYMGVPKEERSDTNSSIAMQEEYLNTYLSVFEDNYELKSVYRDEGFQTADTNREGFQQMLKDIREHKINCVIVSDLSRLSLSMEDATYYIMDFFVTYEIRFISLHLPTLDSYRNPKQLAHIFLPIQGVYHDEYRRQSSVKIRSAFHRKRKMGQFIGAFAPYGYRKDPADKHHLLIDENAARVVQDIYKKFAEEGMSKNAIALKLNELGIPSPTAYKRKKGLEYMVHGNQFVAMWVPKTIGDILKNKVYLGHMVQGRYRKKSYRDPTQFSTPEEEWYIVENTHVPIIQEELFERAQKRNEKSGRSSRGKDTHLFAGVLKCYDCGHIMILSGGGKHRKKYFQCRTYRDKSREICTRHMIQADILEEAVLGALRNQMKQIQSLKAIMEEIDKTSKISDEIMGIDRIRNERERELEQVMSDRFRLHGDWQNDFLEKEEYYRMREEYTRQIKDMMPTLEALKQEKQFLIKEREAIYLYLEIFLQYETVTELHRDIILELIDTIYVHEDGKVEVLFAYGDRHQSALDFIKRFR